MPEFRFRSPAARRYLPSAAAAAAPRPLFRRWEALGLLLLVPAGAASVPGVPGWPAAGTLIFEAASSGDLRARFFSFAPPLLALFLAFRASRRLVRSFRRLLGVAAEATLSAAVVFIGFQIGLYLALTGASVWLPRGMSLWVSTLPGALAGWALLLVVACIRLLHRRAARDLETVRQSFLARRRSGKDAP